MAIIITTIESLSKVVDMPNLVKDVVLSFNGLVVEMINI